MSLGRVVSEKLKFNSSIMNPILPSPTSNAISEKPSVKEKQKEQSNPIPPHCESLALNELNNPLVGSIIIPSPTPDALFYMYTFKPEDADCIKTSIHTPPSAPKLPSTLICEPKGLSDKMLALEPSTLICELKGSKDKVLDFLS